MGNNTEMPEKLSPFQIEILLWYYSRPGDFPGISELLAVQAECNRFEKAGLLIGWQNKPQKYYGNPEALEVWFNAISSVPLPKQIWIIPEK